MATSLDHLNLVLWPAQVCFCTGIIFKTSFLKDASRKVNDSLMGREKIQIFQGFDLHVLDQTSQLDDRDPFLVLGFASVSSMASA